MLKSKSDRTESFLHVHFFSVPITRPVERIFQGFFKCTIKWLYTIEVSSGMKTTINHSAILTVTRDSEGDVTCLIVQYKNYRFTVRPIQFLKC
jgi:hypothetical protein